MPVCAGHPSPRVLCIAQPAERPRLHLRRTGPAGAIKRPLMLLQALVEPAKREAEIAAKVVDPRALRRKILRGGGRGLVEHGKGFVEAIRHAQAGGEPEPGATPLDVGIGDHQGLLEGGHGFRDGAEVVQDLAAEQGQRTHIGALPGQGEPALDETQGSFAPVLRGLRPCRFQVGLGGAIVVGSVEMLCAQHQVPASEPIGRPPVQLAAPAPEQRVVDALLNQGVGEEEVIALRVYQAMPHQVVAVPPGPLEQGDQDLGGKALADDRGCLQRLPVGQREPIQACQHQTPDRPRDAALGALLGMPQQLLQKQRIAGGAFDATLGELAERVEIGFGKPVGLARLKRAEVHRDDRLTGSCRAPVLTERIALDPRGRDQ